MRKDRMTFQQIKDQKLMELMESESGKGTSWEIKTIIFLSGIIVGIITGILIERFVG